MGRTNSELPIHAPNIPMMKSTLFLEAMRSPDLTKEEREAFQYILSARSVPSQNKTITSFPPTAMFQKDYILMVQNDIIERALVDDSNRPLKGHFGYVFTVVELLKHRRRVVIDTLSMNTLCPDPPNPNFTPLNRLKRIVFKGSHACTFDMKCMYFQIPLAPEVRNAFTFRGTDNQYYRFKRCPMGFKWSVVIAQAIMRFLVSKMTANVSIEIYVDNVLFVGSKDEVTKARQEFISVCAEYNATIGDLGEVQTTATYRGMVLDFTLKTVSLADSFIHKLKQRLSAREPTWCDTKALISTIVYAMTIRSELYSIYHLLKCLARNALVKPKQHVKLWKEAQQDFEKAFQLITSNVPVKPVSPHSRVAVVTDASTQHSIIAGIIVTTQGKIITVVEKAGVYESINDLEAQAFYMTLRQGEHYLHHKRLWYFGDNTSVLSTLQSGMSRSFHLNMWIGRILMRMTNISSYCEYLTYLPSASNPADAPSRRERLSSHHSRVLTDICNRLRLSKGVE